MSVLISPLFSVLVWWGAASVSQPATTPAEDEIEYAMAAVRVFRIQAMIFAAPMRIYATEAERINERDRADLLRVIEEFEDNVHDEQARIRADLPSPHEVTNRAAALALPSEGQVLEPWLEAHPDAAVAIDRQQLIFELIIDDLPDGGQGVIAAARRAGLDRGAENRANAIVRDAINEFAQFAQRLQTSQEAAARAPEGSAKQLAGMTALTDAEMFKLETARTVRQRLRELIHARRHGEFDEQLTKLADR